MIQNKYFKIIFIILALIVFCILSIRILIKLLPRNTKLSFMDRMLNKNKSIHSATIFIKDFKNKKEHRYKKGKFNEDKFYLASASKLYAHTIIFQLIDEGLIQYE